MAVYLIKYIIVFNYNKLLTKIYGFMINSMYHNQLGMFH